MSFVPQVPQVPTNPAVHPRILGTRRAKTARQNCILVAWGFETQMRLMWTKVDFVVAVASTESIPNHEVLMGREVTKYSKNGRFELISQVQKFDEICEMLSLMGQCMG